MVRIESLLSARLFLAPQSVGGRMFFISNLGGRLSLYAMDDGGSVPEPLLPPHIALQNPELIGGLPFCVYPGLGRILVMIDADGDENYQPMTIPIEGGFPEQAFGGRLDGHRVHLSKVDVEKNLAYLGAESRREALQLAYRGDLGSGALEELGRSAYGCEVSAVDAAHARAILIDSYAMGDHVLYLWSAGQGERRLLHGVPIETRTEGQKVPLNAIGHPHFTDGGRGQALLFTTALFSDTYGLGYLDLGSLPELAAGRSEPPGRTAGGMTEGAGPAVAGAAATGPAARAAGAPVGSVSGAQPPLQQPQPQVQPVAITGTQHEGAGELVDLEHLHGDRYGLAYNIDGCSWLYEGTFDEQARAMRLDRLVCGKGGLANGVLESARYEADTGRHALSFSTATSPTQIYTVERVGGEAPREHTRERILGVPRSRLAEGEDASFASFDGRRVSARLYLPSSELAYTGPRPLVYYLHGGPQSQERPNFAWFSMPLIQFLTLSGFAVFVPNARGSTGYGLAWTKEVDRDWGGKDRLDHVHAMGILARDGRVDVRRAGVMGRSYGGYMTLTLAARHPDLWAAAIDMFGPFDLLTFLERIPETWKPYFDLALGDPVKDRDFLVERSPRTHIAAVRCPLLVIQGKNDPRVVERESRDLVEHMRSTGKTVDYLVFENEGHNVLKFENRVRCYDAIRDFLSQYLRP